MHHLDTESKILGLGPSQFMACGFWRLGGNKVSEMLANEHESRLTIVLVLRGSELLASLKIGVSVHTDGFLTNKIWLGLLAQFR